MRLSILELQSSLAPFIRRPPEEKLRKAHQAYGITHNLPALMWSLHELQPALLPAAAAQAMVVAAGGAAGSAAGGGGGRSDVIKAAATLTAAEGHQEGGGGQLLGPEAEAGAVLLSALPAVVAAVLPGWKMREGCGRARAVRCVGF